MRLCAIISKGPTDVFVNLFKVLVDGKGHGKRNKRLMNHLEKLKGTFSQPTGLAFDLAPVLQTF